MQALKFDNAEQDDLYYYLDKAAKSAGTLDQSMHIKTFMENWVELPGYPLVTITREVDGNFTLLQERFFAVDETEVEDELEVRTICTFVIFFSTNKFAYHS